MLVTSWQNWTEAANFAGFWLRVSWDSCTWNWTCARYIVTCLKFCIHRGKYWTSSMSWRLTSYRLKITQGNPGVHTPSNGLYGEALFERSTFFMLPAGIWEGRKICHFHPATKRFYCCEKVEKIVFLFCDFFRSKRKRICSSRKRCTELILPDFLAYRVKKKKQPFGSSPLKWL